MRRRLATIAAAAVIVSALLFPSSASASSSPSCGANPQLNAYADNNYVGLLGILCPQFVGLGADQNWGDQANAFRGSDNDAMNSFKVWNPTNQTWCLVFHADANYSGAILWYTIDPLGNAWVGPLGGNVGTFADRTSSVELYTRPASGCL